ncbi:MAG: HAD-IA family hydrolase [Rhodospirillales bacterium]|nr:HAD-IA family hydrolase [Rhodospirillales bacterium]
MDAAAKPDLVIFDCDGVLVDSELLASRLLAEALSAQGYMVTAAECRDRYTGISIRSVIEMVEAVGGRALPADFEDRIRANDLAVFARELKAVPGIAEALARIPTAKCVASSGAPEKIRHSLTITGLLDFFEPHLFSAHMVKRGKPAPDLFLFAAAAMGAEAARCMVVEDSTAGVVAARAAGMPVLGFAGGGHAGDGYGAMLTAAGAVRVFDDMAELPGLLQAVAPSSG